MRLYFNSLHRLLSVHGADRRAEGCCPNRRKALERLKQRGISKPAHGGPAAGGVRASADFARPVVTTGLERQIEQNRQTARKRLQQTQQNLRDASSIINTGHALGSPSAHPTGNTGSRLRPAIRRQDYIEYDFSTMKNTNGGFINREDDQGYGDNALAQEKQRSLEEWQREQRARRALYENQPPPAHMSLAPKCTQCNINTEMDPVMKDVFHLQVCKSCVKAHPEKYSLLTKTECKEDYFLTDPELNDASLFDRLEKPNPHSGTFAHMQLFVRCEIEKYAFEKWGGEEGLDNEWQRREEGKIERREKKYQQKVREMRLKTRAQEFTTRLKEKKYGKDHTHEFGAPVDGGSNEDGIPVQKRRCFGCGIEIEEIML
ncbi:AFL177Wp [Eremothecium gossypii ATCC 10895]|uniref:AFL177Wp n=1 Tax=Eremothecium gossypii (strain ATCC 10895 / CBS 109.51 / FGSC 9923 / NRRL Y-1056) TaxID=284811 RepID=Q755K0_EREGS|nr:AFL177Wp [Eremothecium gossypii ATCC 10895]AAS53197.2 AFL177Wp [Eremothecium gossypii ATCC 10895]AEY97507.1 FAFL177Wp [Eremothecium gossypii FDAG1]